MKNILITAFLVLLVFSSYSNVKLDKIAIVDLEQVMETVFSGKSSSVKKIKEEKENFQATLNEMKKNILKLQDRKEKEANEARKLAYDKEIQKLKKKYSEFYKVRSYQIETMVKNIQEPLFKEIYTVVQSIANQEGYTLVINRNSEAIFFYKADIDITNKVIEFFEKHYGEEEEE